MSKKSFIRVLAMPSHTVGFQAVVVDTAAGPVVIAGDMLPYFDNWTGRWGSTAATNFFKVTLDSKPNTQTFNAAMLLTNDVSTYGWESLQLKLELVE